MSVRIDITGLRRERVAVMPSPLAELCMALHALSEPGHHPGLRDWVTKTTGRIGPHLADRMSEADFLWRSTLSDLFMPYAGIPGRDTLPGATLADELDLLDKLTDDQFADAGLEFVCTPADAARERNVLSDTRTRRMTLELAAARGPRQLRFARRLLEDPPAVRAWLRRFLEDCGEAFFAETWSRISGPLVADARRKTELLRHKGLAGALPAMSASLALDERAGRITVDKMIESRTDTGDGGLLFVPTSLGRPHLTVLHRFGWQPVIQYPVSAAEPAAPPSVEQLALRMTALSHPVRMRLCRDLARSAYTTGELAQMLDMTPPEISRHLAVLRKAGLLTTRRRGRYVLHQLDVPVVARLGSDFLEGLLR